MSSDEDEAVLKKHCAQLMEHFENVQIFVSKVLDKDNCGESESGDTVDLSLGEGNIFARRGQVREWLIRSDEFTRQQVRESD